MTEKLNFVNLFHKKLTESDISGARQMLLEAPMKDLQTLQTNGLHIKRAYVILNDPSIETPERLTSETIGIMAFWGSADDEREIHWKKLLEIWEKEKSMVKRKVLKTPEKSEEKNEEEPKEKTKKEPEPEERPKGKGVTIPADTLDADSADIHAGDDGVFKDGETEESKEPENEEAEKEKPRKAAEKPKKAASQLSGGGAISTMAKDIHALGERVDKLQGILDEILEALQTVPLPTKMPEVTDTALWDELRQVKGLGVLCANLLLGDDASSERLPSMVETSAEDFEANQK